MIISIFSNNYSHKESLIIVYIHKQIYTYYLRYIYMVYYVLKLNQ